jgi:hypothetical protein
VNEITIEDFIVIKSLKVTNISIEKNRVSADYIVTDLKGNLSSNSLIYSYNESYFDPESQASKNLASIMLAQVAMNYGLFCEVIQFDGHLDAHDQRFILDMTENTCREILVQKLLVQNEFLLPHFQNVIIPKRQKYTQAQIKFIGEGTPIKNKIGFSPDPNTYALLSSGGKDSLLSYGVLNEFGQVYPVFVNESGRHWFTAVNAFRHLESIDTNTKKPWCNSDRMFNWMLKQLPFIRPDFNTVRSDMYPIRLWTVSVFLFGVLPVALKYQTGNIVIGNEYDTTVKGNFNGISHYNGLYDQSKYFDNALTRYFKQKEWNIKQFSILRSMSELLILKMLVKRYPDLQKHQVSCHAAHSHNDRMYPCGKCEKCRRIIGMLKAMDEDPQRCGYTEDQIKAGLKALSMKSVKQLGADAAHLYYKLLAKDLIEKNEFTHAKSKSYPYIEKLRFDQERSTPDDLPAHVAKNVYPLLNQYADGVAEFINKKWQATELNIILNKKIINNE